MDLAKSPLFSMITKRLAWLGQRQQVLAHNIANSDTPGFMPRDVKPLDFRRLAAGEARRLEVSTTNARHLNSGRQSPKFKSEEQTQTYETTPAGNAVVLEQQLMKVARTVMDYQLMTNLYRKHVNMVKTAIGRNSG